jgi:phosphoribosylformylglycinamidine synthase
VERIFEKWDLHAVDIGVVTSDGLLRVKDRGRVVAEVPCRALADEAPLYDRPRARPPWQDEVQRLDPEGLAADPPPAEALRRLLASPNVASTRWIYRQYDHTVRTNTVVPPGAGTAVVRLKGTSRALAISVDGNGRACYLDPRLGARLVVAEAARNVACAGASPIGATNNLNFGSPERPEIMWQLVETIEGMAEACRALDIPITGGNVSLYNETGGRAIYPTPVVGVVGLLEDVRHALGCRFPEAGLDVLLLGEIRGELGGSEYLKRVHGLVRGRPPQVDLRLELALQRLLPEAARAGLLRSAHDVAAGGLAVTLAECTFGERGVGVEVDVPAVAGGLPPVAATLFGEPAGVVVVSADRGARDALLALAGRHGVPAAVVGRTGGGRIRLAVDGRMAIDEDRAALERIWSLALGERFAPGRARE